MNAGFHKRGEAGAIPPGQDIGKLRDKFFQGPSTNN